MLPWSLRNVLDGSFRYALVTMTGSPARYEGLGRAQGMGRAKRRGITVLVAKPPLSWSGGGIHDLVVGNCFRSQPVASVSTLAGP